MAISDSTATMSIPTALPARVKRALDNQLRTTSSELSRHLQATVQEAEFDLDRRAETAREPGRQVALLQAVRRLRERGMELVPCVLEEVATGITGLHAPRVPRREVQIGTPVEGLSLVDDSEPDEGTLLDAIVSRAESRNGLALQLMGHRYGVLAGGPAFDAEHLPAGPNALCNALRTACAALGFDLDSRLALYKLFDKAVQAHYPVLLDILNKQLAEDGILPHLGFVPVRTRPAQAAGGKDAASAAGDGRPAQHPANPSSRPAPSLREPPKPAPDTGFAVLQGLLARRRKLLAKLRPGGHDERVRETLMRDEVLDALRRMRGQPDKQHDPAEVRQTLLAQARQLHGHGVALADADNDGFELFGLFLAQLQRDLRAGSPGGALVARLRLPLLQLAMRDQRFFSDPQHPARMLLDAVSLAGARWLAADDVDAQWLGLLQRAAGSVLEDPDAGHDTFVSANHALQGGLQAIARKFEMAERRQVEAARGRERLVLARQRAAGEIAAAVSGRSLPRFHATLLEQAWADVLSLTLLRSGDASEAWRSLRATTAAIVDAGASPGQREPDPALTERLQGALEQVGYHAEDANAIARQLANGRADEAELASRTELIVQLKARTRLGEDTVPPVDEAARAARSAVEQAAYERLAALQEGCWIELHDPLDDTLLRRRLAWVGARSGQALVLNRRGIRIEAGNLEALARGIATGDIRLLDQDLHPAEDAWQATITHLTHLAGNDGAPETHDGQ